MRKRKPVPVHNLKVTRRGKVRKRNLLWRWRRALYLGGLATVLGAAGLVYILSQIELPVDPRVERVQKQTSFICADHVERNCNASNAMAELHGAEDRVLVSYDQIPLVMKQAVIAAEDRDFFDHRGVDPLGIARAAYRDIRNEGVRQGGSTITQQYVKKSYLSDEQTITRKLKEAVMAIKLEQQLPKEEILNRYLNTVYFGRGAYGVQAAARAWFGHDVQAIDAGEAAFLAGLLRNPNGADPYRSEAMITEAERRRRVVIEAMVEEGYLTQTEAEEFLAVPMDPNDESVPEGERFMRPPPVPSTLGEDVLGAEVGSEYFAGDVLKWLRREFGDDAVYGGGLKVYTTLDLRMQRAAYEAVTSTLDREGDPSAALVALDDQGRIKAMVGGTNWAESELNLATAGPGQGLGRQPGSTFKTFALAELVRQGYSVQSVMPSPRTLEVTDPRCVSGGEEWSPSGGAGGAVSMVTATKNSYNTTYVQLMMDLGPQAVVDTAVDMGVSELAGATPFCSLVLGAGEVSVLGMAAGYSTLANEGVAKSPIMVTRVEFPDGSVRHYEPETKEILTPDQAGRITHALQQVIEGGTGRQARFGREAAGKTGTTDDNGDAWFVGYTPRLTAAVWMGHTAGRIPMDNVHGERVQGGNFPARIWAKFMTEATSDFDSGEFREMTAAELSDGEVFKPDLGKTSVVTTDSSQTPTTSPAPTATTTPQATTEPETPEDEPETPPSTVPPSTAPPTTASPTTAPPDEGGQGQVVAAGGP